MATLRECLESLPPDMRLRDLAAIPTRIVTVQEVLAAGRHLGEQGFTVVDQPINYGRQTIKAIIVAGMAAYREET